MSNVTITGGFGFIGSHLTEICLEAGHRVTVIDDCRTSVVREMKGVNHIQGPLPHYTTAGNDSDVIFHLASPVGPVGVLDHAGYIVREVIELADDVALAAWQDEAPLVYVSTSELYGDQPQPVNESRPRIFQAGSSARMEYAVAKLAAETMLLNRNDIDVRVVRPFNVAGPRQKEDGGFVLPRFMRQAATGSALTVYGDGQQRRAFTHVREIALGIYNTWRYGQAQHVYNLGNPDNEMTIMRLAETVIELTGSTSQIELTDPVELWGTGFREAADKVPDISRAKRDLRWEPTIGVRDIIMDCVR